MAGYPSGSNTFVPSHEATGKLQVEFSRNAKKFKLNQYVKLLPVKKDVGYFLVITAEEAARIINSNLSDFVWADGQEAPMGNENTESFTFSNYATLRYNFGFNLGNKAVEQASWDIVASHGRIAAQKAMTARTIKVVNTLTGASWGSNTNNATSLAGGKLDVAAVATPYIKKAFRKVASAILQATIGVVNREEIVAVMSPNTAGLISEAPELVDHFKNNQFALAQVRQDAPNQNGQWGLPDVLYGIKVVVEDAVQVTSKKGATKVTSYCMPDNAILFLSRPEGLVGADGVSDFSTVQIFSYEDMVVETKTDPDNRRTQGRVVDDYDVELVAPAAGFYLTAATG